MLAKLWDWDRGFACAQVFEGHSHYVMQVALNPKDPSTFATASLDRTVKVWSLGQPTANLTLEGHEKGVNAVDYYPGGERPYLVSGADDRTARVWDYTTKACVQVRPLGTSGFVLLRKQPTNGRRKTAHAAPPQKTPKTKTPTTNNKKRSSRATRTTSRPSPSTRSSPCS